MEDRHRRSDIIIAQPWEDLEKYKDNPVRHTTQDYLKFIDQPEFFNESDKSKKRSKGGFK